MRGEGEKDGDGGSRFLPSDSPNFLVTDSKQNTETSLMLYKANHVLPDRSQLCRNKNGIKANAMKTKQQQQQPDPVKRFGGIALSL